jgi:hypothetical protein
MILEIDNLRKYGVVADTLKYRGFDIDFYEDVSGHQLIAIWEDKIFEFGVYNTQAKEDMKLIIDDHLDTIERYLDAPPAFHGAKLEYFENGGFRDIRLWYRGRLLAVYPGPFDQPSILSIIQENAQEKILEELRRRGT